MADDQIEALKKRIGELEQEKAELISRNSQLISIAREGLNTNKELHAANKKLFSLLPAIDKIDSLEVRCEAMICAVSSAHQHQQELQSQLSDSVEVLRASDLGLPEDVIAEFAAPGQNAGLRLERILAILGRQPESIRGRWFEGLNAAEKVFRSFAARKNALKARKKNPVDAAKMHVEAFWGEWRAGKLRNIETKERFAMECMRRWPELRNSRVICDWCRIWEKGANDLQ